MKYSKKPLTLEQQAELLLKRGLLADKNSLVKILSSINYYRLSGYLYPFRERGSSFFVKNTKLEDIIEIYDFDKSLRFLLFEGLKKIEIYFKTKVAYTFSHRYGCFAYSKKDCFPNMTEDSFSKFFAKIKSETKRSKESFVRHFFERYGDCHEILPLWMAVELFSFGSISLFFSGLENSLKAEIALIFGVNHRILRSWIISFCYVRNLCAHHSRLWNRQLAIKPKIPKKYNYLKDLGLRNDKLFFVFLLMYKIVEEIDFSCEWTKKAKSLFLGNSNFLKGMGFIKKWEKYFDEIV